MTQPSSVQSFLTSHLWQVALFLWQPKLIPDKVDQLHCNCSEKQTRQGICTSQVWQSPKKSQSKENHGRRLVCSPFILTQLFVNCVKTGTKLFCAEPLRPKSYPAHVPKSESRYLGNEKTSSTDDESKKILPLPERDKQPTIYHLTTAKYGCNQSNLTDWLLQMIDRHEAAAPAMQRQRQSAPCTLCNALCNAHCAMHSLSQQLNHHLTMFLNMSSLAGLRLSFNRFHPLILTSVELEANPQDIVWRHIVLPISCLFQNIE